VTIQQSQSQFQSQVMKFYIILLLGFLTAVAAEQGTAGKQQDVNALLWKIYQPLHRNRLKKLTCGFSPISSTSIYTDEGVAAKKIVDEFNCENLLEQKKYFSLFNPKHREETLMLFELFMSCKTWDPCIRNNAAYFRERINENVFVYALYVTVIHHPLGDGVVLPPLYEVTPHMFTNREIIDRAYSAKMTQNPGKFQMNFTGTWKNPEQRVAYFGEDIGINVHHVSWHMDYPFWWKDNYGYHLDRKGELFFWAHHQMTVRYDAERLSNNLNPVHEIYWNKPIDEGFAPHTTYKYGGEFPSRPDNVDIADVDGVAKVREVMAWERRIRDAIANGYVTGRDGKQFSILHDRGIDMLGNIIEQSEYSPDRAYYGGLHNMAHIIIGRQGDPKGKFDQLPSVMEHFETATRDPAFFQVHKYINNMFKELKDKLPPYTREDMMWNGIELEDISVDGNLLTYFEDFEFSLKNALDDSVSVSDVDIMAVVKRINHKEFSYMLRILSKRNEEVDATVRIFMCPRRDNNKILYSLESGRWGCIEMDKFWKKLYPGGNILHRHSNDSTVTVPDVPSFS
ncbi:unnamed protein product, partial [Meganyctiphanes norvegica]